MRGCSGDAESQTTLTRGGPQPRRTGLERAPSHRFLCAVRPGHLQQGTLAQGLLTGTFAAAATAGALLGFGIQQGMPARPFNAVASLLLGDRADAIWGFHPVVTVVGVLTQAALSVGWGLLFARLAGGMRGLRFVALALVVAAAAMVVHVILTTRILGGHVSDVLVPAQVIALHLVLGIALAVGMRLATSYVWKE